MDKLIFESSSDIVDFLIFQDRINGLWRFLEKMKNPLEDYLSGYESALTAEKERIKKRPGYYEVGDIYFTKHEVLLGLEFADNYSGGTGNDADFFPQYFYSSILILSISLLESLVREVIATVEDKSTSKFVFSKNPNNPFLIKALLFFNEHGHSYNMNDEKLEEFRKMNIVRNFYVHKLHEGDFGRLRDDVLEQYVVSYQTVKSSLLTVARVAELIESEY